MSRIGKKPVPIPDKVKVDVKGHTVTVTGPKGTLVRTFHPDMTIALEGKEVTVARPTDLKKHRALHGLTRATLVNMMVGVSHGYQKVLQMVGVGYKSEAKGKVLIINAGFSHPVVVSAPEGIKLSNDPKENKIMVDGIDKELVGQVAANIRRIRPPEPYKGKGIRYFGEVVQQKAGKTAG